MAKMGSDSISFRRPADAEWPQDRRSTGKWSLTPFLISRLFLLEDAGVTHHILHLPHRDDDDLLGGIDLENLHVVADGVPDDVVVAQLLFVRQDDSHPIFHGRLLWFKLILPLTPRWGPARTLSIPDWTGSRG